MSMSHRYRSAHRSPTVHRMFSAYVTPMRKKSGSTGNAPGDSHWTTTAEPSRSVLIATRIAISRNSLRRRSRSGTVVFLRELADQVEDRQVHRDDDAADED